MPWRGGIENSPSPSLTPEDQPQVTPREDIPLSFSCNWRVFYPPSQRDNSRRRKGETWRIQRFFYTIGLCERQFFFPDEVERKKDRNGMRPKRPLRNDFKSHSSPSMGNAPLRTHTYLQAATDAEENSRAKTRLIGGDIRRSLCRSKIKRKKSFSVAHK